MQTPQDELLDVLDEHGEPTGVTKARAKVHEDGDWHRAIHIWVVREGNNVLLQRRSLNKDLEAGKVDGSVGGHYRTGELFVDALREAYEELGITLKPGLVEFLGVASDVRSYPDADPPMLDREHQEIYVCRDDRELDRYILDPNEVDTVYELPIDKAIALFRDGEYVAAEGFDSMRRPSNALLYEHDLPSQGRAVHVESLNRVKEWLEGVPADLIAAKPF